MYKIRFFKDKDGKEPVLEYIKELQSKTNKDSRIKSEKILSYLDILRKNGTRAGIPYVKHLDDDIWELRPLRDRILFVGWKDNTFILLHHFMKSTQKTPPRELERAKKNFELFKKGEVDE